jgi:chromosome segregation ATPase
MDHREADTKAKDASSAVYSRMATDADRIGTPGSSGNSPHTSATAAATAVAMQSHAEAEGLRIELEQARSDLRRHEERARAVAGDLDAAWTSAGEAHMGSRHLATELDRAKAESDLLAHELQGNKSYELIASERARFEARLAAANDVSRRLGEEKGDVEAALKAESRERARVEHARETLEKHLTDADTQIASLREELARTLGHLTAARDEAAAASLARTELEIEMRSMRHDADEVTRRLDEHADANASELEAAARDRTRLAEALREVTAERDAALRR